MKRSFLLLWVLITSFCVFAQGDQVWKGKRCAVVLTYDDAIDEHLDHAIPVLDSLGLKATFYITAFSSSMQHRLSEWKHIAAKGYELGNHTLYHPCNGGLGREWVPKEYDLTTYTVRRMMEEIRMTNVLLEAMDGKKKRSFAYTCGEMKIGDVEFIKDLKDDFVAARAVRNEMHKIQEVDLYNVDCYLVNNHTADQMKVWVDQAIQTNSLLVILFHGVGGGNGLNISTEEHRKFLSYVKAHERDIWVAPMVEVGEFVREWQGKTGKKL